MKKLKEELKYGKKGITLISLVVTIIVLLILAGITITTLTGENGILNRAKEAKNKTEEAQEKESLELAVISSQMEDVNTLEITEEKLSDAIKQQFGNNKDFSVTDNEDGSFLVSMNDTQRMYYIDETGKIIDKILKISTADELKSFRDDVNNGNSYEGWYVYLTNDIILDINYEWKSIGVYNSEATNIADERNTYFSGIFDGCNHKISNIYINTENRGNGLFGIIKNGKVQNLGITNSNFIINYNAGAITGFLQNSKIVNCYSNINITTQGNNLINIGGIAGNVLENSEINNSYSTSTIVASGESSQTGGIAGGITNSAINNCYNNGKIEGSEMIGGIAGYSKNCIIYSCYNSNNITGNSDVGSIIGVVGNKGVKINNCYYLENTVNGANETDVIDGVTVKTSEELKALAPTLGTAFKEAPEGTNDGYPILQWQ